MLNEWILDSFDIEADFAGIHNDAYSRNLDEYKVVFDNEIEQLANEYELKIRKKRKKSDGKVVLTKNITTPSKDVLPLGRVNGSRFKGITQKEKDTVGSVQRET
nr:hypothetical protein [Tanacetum cinerariifolium]